MSRHQLKSFLKSAEILRIRGLTHHAVTPEQKFQSGDQQHQQLHESTIEENSESQEQSGDEDRLKRHSSHPSEMGGPKRPRLTLRPPPKPVTTTIIPGNTLPTPLQIKWIKNPSNVSGSYAFFKLLAIAGMNFNIFDCHQSKIIVK